MAKKSQEKTDKASIEETGSHIKKTDLNTYFIFGAIILVLIVGIFAIFSPGSQGLENGNPACGKIVIAADGPKLANNVSASLSEARFFLVVDPLSKKLIETIRNPYRSQQPNPQIVYLIAGKGEEAVIVSSIDQQSYNMLMQYGIRVFGGYEGPARKVISLYRQAKISQTAPVDAMPVQTPIVAQTPMTAQSPIMAQAPQMSQGTSQAAYTWPGCVFSCPSCGITMNGQVNGAGACPACPRCRRTMIQNNSGIPAGQAAWGMQDMSSYPYCQNPVFQGGIAQAVTQTPANMNMGNQVAFGWGEQPFVCPNCNWRLKCKPQGNNFPFCPNCNSPMATDMSNNNGFQWWKDTQLAANMNQLQPQMNQMTNQPNFWQGPESTGFFLCPNCNWRMYAQAGQNEYPRCPNCQQIMARSGAYQQNQNIQNNQAVFGFTGNNTLAGAQQIALQTPVAAPPILNNAVMPHAYRGVCSNCHQILDAQVSNQNTVYGNITAQNQAPTRVVLGQTRNK